MTQPPEQPTESLPTAAYRKIQQLGLEPHPEGGYYRRFFTSNTNISTPTGERPSATMIYYLLPQGAFSQWHRLRQEEIWIFMEGDPISVHHIDTEGVVHTDLLGREAHHKGQTVIPGNLWFAATPTEQPIEGYSLACCMVTPGFDFADFELGNRDSLIRQFPHLSDLISRLTR
ncbi:cupin domain-containing protein [Hahella ganghwensis]|uniref:cupin domain-containing protein n=1 Tax=Hahella ganghwensis TaxID=286420 RepID=UPI0003687C10|nr:cupin domain-containing protein [Hahella ganghwensis]